MFNKKAILKYESAIEQYPDSIVPAKTKTPEWYKNISRWKNGEVVDLKNVNLNSSIKQCMPFIESLTSGYMVVLPYDIYVKNNNDTPYIAWNNNIDPINTPSWRNEVANRSLVPPGFFPLEYTWNMCVSFEVPKGYSMLVTHPLNRYELPFITLTGIIDGGFPVYPHGNFPFYIRQGFEGLIEQGTPIAQIIPFRQEQWTALKTEGLTNKGEFEHKKSNLKISGFYKNNFWSKKKYL